MTLEELISELRENILDDAEGPDLRWTDAALIRWLNEGYQRFVRRTLILRDNATASVTQITLATGIDQYKLHESIIQVLSARYDQDTCDLPRAGHHQFDDDLNRATDWFDVSQFAAVTPARPRAWSTDEAGTSREDPEDDASADLDPTERRLRVYPAPGVDEDGNLINLRVLRLPLADLSASAPSVSPEIPSEWHLALCDWAAYRALSNRDVDAEAIQMSRRRRREFDESVRLARQETKKLLVSPTKVKFGASGWSWD